MSAESAEDRYNNEGGASGELTSARKGVNF